MDVSWLSPTCSKTPRQILGLALYPGVYFSSSSYFSSLILFPLPTYPCALSAASVGNFNANCCILWYPGTLSLSEPFSTACCEKLLKAVSALSVQIRDQSQVFEWSGWEEQTAVGSPGGAGHDTDTVF